MFDLGLDKEKEELVARVATLARERFAPRAAAYDRDAAFPAEDFVDLFKAGLFGASIPREYGGLGLGPYFDDTFTLWMMTKELAKADLSLARCWEGHINQDFHFGPGTATVYTRSAPNSTSFHAEPCTSPLLVVARAGSTAHSR